ncbi:MAG: membrane-associated, eicosanoid/glutathione metabolism protein [Piptocephalis tieghemiana]|nr:MAG: membrane-associated, eicosanoid/glutathione metabolism protein [Piptocephalis tieghemiana]
MLQLPTLARFLPFHALYYSFLTGRIILLRRSLLYPIGDGLVEAKEARERGNRVLASKYAQLAKASRAHGNFAEQVPLTLLSLLCLELNGVSTSRLRILHTLLLITRLFHAELGMMGKSSYGVGRPIGVVLQMALMLGTGIYNGLLVWRGSV